MACAGDFRAVDCSIFCNRFSRAIWRAAGALQACCGRDFAAIAHLRARVKRYFSLVVDFPRVAHFGRRVKWFFSRRARSTIGAACQGFFSRASMGTVCARCGVSGGSDGRDSGALRSGRQRWFARVNGQRVGLFMRVTYQRALIVRD